MQRKIGKFETAPAVANEFACFNLVGVLKLENAPPPEDLQKALDVLQSHHPALRTRLEKDNSSYHFYAIEGQKIPLKVVPRTGKDQWIPEAEDYLNTPVDWAAGPLLACTYLQGAEISELIFAFHHSIVDAVSLVSFFDDFLNLCTAQQTGKELTGYPPLEPVEEMFPPQFKGLRMQMRTLGFMARTMASEMSIRRKTRGKRTPPIHIQTTGRILTMELSEEETTALQKSARTHKVTLNSVQQAAILTATWQHLYQREAIPLKYILFQNLRPYLFPPVGDEVLGSYIAMIQLVIAMDPERDFWDICEEINQAVYQTGKSGDKFISANMSGSMLKMLFRFKAFRMANTAMNYSGSLDLPETYGSIRVLDVRGFASNFGLGPEFSAQTVLFRNKLVWNMLYLETDMNAETAQGIADTIRQILVEHASSD